jgi:hypothetical protein
MSTDLTVLSVNESRSGETKQIEKSRERESVCVCLIIKGQFFGTVLRKCRDCLCRVQIKN